MPEWLTAPTPTEWQAVYLPLAVAMVGIMAFELRTKRVPNAVSLGLLALALVVRGLIGPEPFGHYIGSGGIGFVVPVCVLWTNGFIGGGGAKLAAAVAFALPPVVAALYLAGLAAVVPLAAVLCRRLSPTSRMPGTPLIAGLALAAVVTAAMVGR